MAPPYKRTSYISILVQVFAWLMFSSLLFLFIPLSWHVSLPYQFWIKQAIVLSLLVSIYYINAKLIVPRLLFKNKTGWYITALVVIVFCFLCAIRITDRSMGLNSRGPWLRESLPSLRENTPGPGEHSPALKESTPGPGEHSPSLRENTPGPGEHSPGLRESTPGPGDNTKEFRRPPLPRHERLIDPAMLMMGLLVLGISTSTTAIRRWQNEQAKQQLLEKERINSELSFLKTQINPHLFFNTLNAIYALTHIDVEKSRTALHKLSRLMRYVLYETDQEQTLLQKEIDFLNDYIELMRFRVIDQVTISFAVPEVSENRSVAPMLLLPFVENAFKHGINTASGGYINIRLSVTGHTIRFEVVNSLQDQQEALAENSGIGIGNTKRRLNLLYPGKHRLEISEDPETKEFRVVLLLDTAQDDDRSDQDFEI